MRFLSLLPPEGERIAAECDLCGSDIYEGAPCYRINGTVLCPDCLGAFARDYFAAFACRAGEEEP